MPQLATALLLANGTHASRTNDLALLTGSLSGDAGLELDVCADPSELTHTRIDAADIILDYNGTARVSPSDDRLRLVLSDEQLAAILAAVERGTPYVGIHAASVQFPGQLPMIRAGDRVYARNVPGMRPLWCETEANHAAADALGASPAEDALLTEAQRRYVSMIGSAFISHPPLDRFRVRIVDREHPITQGVADFEIEDEWYELAGDLGAVQVLAEAGGCPLLYTRRWGLGRVHYTALGHDHRAFANPSYRRLLAQAIVWGLQPD
jgi:type 1 glutamine amidotransferase